MWRLKWEGMVEGRLRAVCCRNNEYNDDNNNITIELKNQPPKKASKV
jgi:hypothetical protein